MKASQIIFEVSRDLNDQVVGAEYVRWTEDQLQSYYAEALVGLAEISKQDFTETVVAPVKAGAGWSSACNCTEVTRIIGESDDEGNVLSYMTQRKDNDQFVWPGSIPSHCLWTTMKSAQRFNSYTLNRNQSGQFRVYPPAIPGQDRYVLLECYKSPDTSDMTFDVPDKFVAAIKQWMLYRALIVDSENNAAIAEIAKTHLTTYTNLYKIILDTSRLQEEKHAADSPVRAPQNQAAH